MDTLLKGLKLEWIRPLIYNLGGRKLLVGGGGMAAITLIMQGGTMNWSRAISCCAVAIVAASTAIAVAMEDNSKGGKK